MMTHCWSILLLISCWATVCNAEHDILSFVGQPAFDRPEQDSLSDVSLIPDTSTTFQASGKIFKFKYFSTSAGKRLKFQIWRPMDGDNWLLLHQSAEVTTEGEDHYVYTCTQDEEFYVMPGDVMGVAILGSSALTYSVVDCLDVSTPRTAGGQFEHGQTTTFSSVSSECRQYSLGAEILYDTNDIVALECTSFDAGEGFQNISSPGYDGVTLYDLEITQCWKITVDPTIEEPEKYAIHVEILALNFEDPYISGDCNGDFLEIRDGDSVFGYMLEELCGSSYPEEVNSTGQSLYLRMVTDDNELTLGTGFNLQFRIYEIDPKTGVNGLMIAGIVIALLIVIGVGVVVFFCFRLKKQRNEEDKKKLQDNEVSGLGYEDEDVEKAHRSRRSRPKSSNKVSPQMLRREKSLYANPTSPSTKMVAHKDADLKVHIPKDDRMPPPSQYQARKKEKTTHWSKLGAGVNLEN